MPVDPLPFYLDPANLPALFAGIAVLLSQVRPIKMWFTKAEFQFEVATRIVLSQGISSPATQISIDIENVGGKRIKVREIVGSFSRDGKHIADIPASMFFRDADDQTGQRFTPIRLAPGEWWTHNLNMFEIFDREDEKLANEIIASVKSEIDARTSLGVGFGVDFPEAISAPAIEFFERKFMWHAGEYEVTFVVHTDSGNLSKPHRFVLYESQAERLKAQKEKYKTGVGINHGAAIYINADLHEM